MATQEVKRKLTAILSADVKGYSRLMGYNQSTFPGTSSLCTLLNVQGSNLSGSELYNFGGLSINLNFQGTLVGNSYLTGIFTVDYSAGPCLGTDTYNVTGTKQGTNQ
jgi:hypothetical protein